MAAESVKLHRQRIDNSAEIALRLDVIRGIAGCIEATSECTTNPKSVIQPFDAAIPGACRGIIYIVEELEALLKETPPIVKTLTEQRTA